jgi:LPS sulfotransferase NodH
LTQAGAGKPHSFFRVPSIPDFAAWWGLPIVDGHTYDTDYIAAAIRSGQNGTDIFGMRIMWDSVTPLVTRLQTLSGPAKNDLAQLTDQFGPLRCIHLSRQDKVAQAVSLALAEQTGLWHRNADGSVLEQTTALADPKYDAAQIAHELQGLQTEAAGWSNWFTANNITPHQVTYEDLAANPQHHLAKTLGFIGLDPSIAQTIEPGTARLADHINHDWAARFRADTGLPSQQLPS